MVKQKLEIERSRAFEHALAQCEAADFDGHTEFHRLTTEQRLDWLAQVATFIYEHKGRANSTTLDRQNASTNTADE